MFCIKQQRSVLFQGLSDNWVNKWDHLTSLPLNDGHRTYRGVQSKGVPTIIQWMDEILDRPGNLGMMIPL